MSNGNYIKLNRSMLKWEWYTDTNTKVVFLHAMLKANWDEGGYKGYKLHPGDVVFGRKKWAEDLGMSEQQIRTAINHLKETGEISTIKATNKFTILHIENWALYQSRDDEATNNLTNEQPTSNQQATNKQPRTKKEKKEKNDKNDKNTTPHTPLEEIVCQLPEEVRGTVREFIAFRKELDDYKSPSNKSPLTSRSLKGLITKARTMSGGDTKTFIEIFEQSIRNGWKGVFEINKRQNNTVSLMDRIRAGEFDE